MLKERTKNGRSRVKKTVKMVKERTENGMENVRDSKGNSNFVIKEGIAQGERVV